MWTSAGGSLDLCNDRSDWNDFAYGLENPQNSASGCLNFIGRFVALDDEQWRAQLYCSAVAYQPFSD